MSEKTIIKHQSNQPTLGMLWFDNSSKSIDQKIQGAAEFYAKKYGQTPNQAFVHPTMLPSTANAYTVANPGLGGSVITVVAVKSVMPNHIWLGVKP